MNEAAVRTQPGSHPVRPGRLSRNRQPPTQWERLSSSTCRPRESATAHRDYIPLGATDRSLEPLVIEPLPLNLKAVQQLLTSYEKIVAQSVEGTEDEITKRGEDNCTSKSGRRAIRLSNGSGPDSTSANLASAEPGSTETDFSASGADLPSVAQWSRSGGVGGER